MAWKLTKEQDEKRAAANAAYQARAEARRLAFFDERARSVPRGTGLVVGRTDESVKLLRGWKAISEYLGVHQKTAQAWHRNWGMPVIRIMGKRVMIHRDALRGWFENLDRAQRSAFQEIAELYGASADPKRVLPGRQAWLRHLREKAERAERKAGRRGMTTRDVTEAVEGAETDGREELSRDRH